MTDGCYLVAGMALKQLGSVRGARRGWGGEQGIIVDQSKRSGFWGADSCLGVPGKISLWLSY
jgi:hypothetical protein